MSVKIEAIEQGYGVTARPKGQTLNVEGVAFISNGAGGGVDVKYPDGTSEVLLDGAEHVLTSKLHGTSEIVVKAK